MGDSRFKIEFEPRSLRGLVQLLEQRIGRTSGPPVRLDLDRYIRELQRYADNPHPDHLPGERSMERLSGMLDRLIEEELFQAYCECAAQLPNLHIANTLFDYYQDHYAISELRSCLAELTAELSGKSDDWSVRNGSHVAFFGGNPPHWLAEVVVNQRVPLVEIGEHLTLRPSSRLLNDVFRALLNPENADRFRRYLHGLTTSQLIGILDDDQFRAIHRVVWRVGLTSRLKRAKAQKINNDKDHPLFRHARLRLKPFASKEFLSQTQATQDAYREWAVGVRIEEFFSGDNENKRVKFWHSQLRHIDDVQEIAHRNEVAAFQIRIGRYDFIEFRDMGAIHVYPRGAMLVPPSVTNLNQLKDRTRVVGSGLNKENGEGWIPHIGLWETYTQALIREAQQR